jgi:hypothetical protein
MVGENRTFANTVGEALAGRVGGGDRGGSNALVMRGGRGGSTGAGGGGRGGLRKSDGCAAPSQVTTLSRRP